MLLGDRWPFWASPWTVPCSMSSQLSSLIKRSLCEVVRLSYLTPLRKTMAVDIKLKVSSPGSENHTWTRTLFWTLWFPPSSESFWQSFQWKSLRRLGIFFCNGKSLPYEFQQDYMPNLWGWWFHLLCQLHHVRLHLNPAGAKQGWHGGL